MPRPPLAAAPLQAPPRRSRGCDHSPLPQWQPCRHAEFNNHIIHLSHALCFARWPPTRHQPSHRRPRRRRRRRRRESGMHAPCCWPRLFSPGFSHSSACQHIQTVHSWCMQWHPLQAAAAPNRCRQQRPGARKHTACVQASGGASAAWHLARISGLARPERRWGSLAQHPLACSRPKAHEVMLALAGAARAGSRQAGNRHASFRQLSGGGRRGWGTCPSLTGTGRRRRCSASLSTRTAPWGRDLGARMAGGADPGQAGRGGRSAMPVKCAPLACPLPIPPLRFAPHPPPR